MAAVANPVEMATLIARNDELTRLLAENTTYLDALTAKSVETEAALAESFAIGETLRGENDTLKDRVSTLETELAGAEQEAIDAGDSEEEALARLEEAHETIQIQALRIVELTSDVEAASDVAEDADFTATAVRDQLENLAGHLVARGATPDLEDHGAGGVSSVYATWKTLATSASPQDKIAARKLYSANRAEIDAEITKTSPVARIERPVSQVEVSGADRATYEQWQNLRREASEVLAPFSKITPVERQRRHTELTIEARKLYNSNKATIDRCISTLP